MSDPARNPVPELQVCAGLAPLVGWDRVAVIAANEPDHRWPLIGSDPLLMHFGDLQQTVHEGPEIDALSSGSAQSVDDLHGDAARAWPLLASLQAQYLPLRTIGLWPLYARMAPTTASSTKTVIGLLVVARDRVQPFTALHVQLLESLADMLAAMLTHRADAYARASGGQSRADNGWFDDVAATSSYTFAAATGMLMAQSGADADVVIAHLRVYGFHHERSIHQVAADVLRGALDYRAFALHR